MVAQTPHTVLQRKTTINDLMIEKNFAKVADLAQKENISKDDVAAILNNSVRALFVGKKVHIYKVNEEHHEKNCHNYAFGGLRGTGSDFDYPTLMSKLNRKKTFAQYLVDLIVIDDVNKYDENDQGQQQYKSYYEKESNLYDVSDGDVNASTAFNIPDNGEFSVRLCAGEHSWRKEGGRWWHKFTTGPYLISVEGNENLGYSVSANLQVRSCNRVDGTAGSFTIPAGDTEVD